MIAVLPATSTDINGGDLVTITGTNFQTVVVVNVTFGGQPGTSLNVVDETTLQVRTPPAPGGNPGAVTIEVVSLNAGSEFLTSAYTYQGSAGGAPAPQTISPTVFTATGAEQFTIQGTNLGVPGGQTQIIFGSLGVVTAQVSLDATIITGRAPVSPGPPPVGPFTVTIDTGTVQVDVPTAVSYTYTAPAAFLMPGQTAADASMPVRLDDTHAVMCTAGANSAWGDADDDVVLVQGPDPVVISQVLRPGGASVGFLNRFNSGAAVLDANTICVYSIGTDQLVATGDDRIILITDAQTAPVVTNIRWPFLNSAPPTAISSSRLAFTTAGPDTVRGTNDDTLDVFEFSGTAVANAWQVQVGRLDTTAGPTNFSIPFSPDGEEVFVLTIGPDSTPGTLDDTLSRLTLATQQLRTMPAPALLGRPIALSGTEVAGPAGGTDGAFATADDELAFFDFSGAPTLTQHLLNTPLVPGAVVPFCRLGAGGIALAVAGPDMAANTLLDDVLVFTDPRAGTTASLSVQGIPVLAPLGNGELVVFDRGTDTTPGTGDESVRRVDAAAVSSDSFFFTPPWNHGASAGTDLERAFAVGPGPDNLYGTGEEQLIVHQTRALGTGGATSDTSLLPLASVLAPASGTVAFVPIGPTWGLLQSAGINAAFGDGNDRILVVRY